MENTDSYLHKKFKKQINVESVLQNDKENKKTEEKADQKETEKETLETNNQRSDNNEQHVPNQSTKNSPTNANFTKSSISIVGNQQSSSNNYISYVVSKPTDHHHHHYQQQQQQPTSFDTKQTNYVDNSSTSSILNNVYCTSYTTVDSYAAFPTNHQLEDVKLEENSMHKLDEQKNSTGSGGKYVCPYCNLVCSKPSVLQKHIRAHTNERPYPCESCGFSFKTRSNLYKHCRSRTHANRLLGNKQSDNNNEPEPPKNNLIIDEPQKPYKPRFHTSKIPIDTEEMVAQTNEYNIQKEPTCEEPLNLTNKNRKRSLSDVTEPVIHKSLIKELLLKNLSSSDMQCPYCKMIFQTVTELDVHKYRSCKGKSSGAKYSRSSSVNVASILTHNKNAFDHIPQMQFPLNSPGPFLGKTRLIDSDKSKSFSFDSGNLPLINSGEPSSPSLNYLLSPIPFDRDKKPGIKLFGGEVKVHSSGETKSFKIDGKDDKYEKDIKYMDYGGSLNENRVVKTSLQSGGTVMTNTVNNFKSDIKTPKEISMSPVSKSIFTFDTTPDTSYPEESSPLYKNIIDFSQNALKLLTPNIRQPTLHVSTKPEVTINNFKPRIDQEEPKPNLYNPVNLFVNGKVVRHVPGIPGPVVAAETPTTIEYISNIIAVARTVQQNLPPVVPDRAPLTPLIIDRPPLTPLIVDRPPLTPLIVDRPPLTPKSLDGYQQQEKSSPRIFLQPERPAKSPNTLSGQSERVARTTGNFLQPDRYSGADTTAKTVSKPPDIAETKSAEMEVKKFARPNSLALKPTVASLKEHHGLTPTKFNQILISPDTPRVAKKYAEHFLHGNYFSYLGLKSSTRPVYCTLNKTQPFYVPYFKKLSMYSEWRQQDTKQDKLYVSNYDSRQINRGYSIAGKTSANLIIHSSYKFVMSETSSTLSEKEDESQKNNTILGGYECNEDYIYVRGRGRGRYVCDQCGIRCKKPSMLKKHIRTHSNDRPYTCSHCNFSFKTKGNLTKHMKSKAHSKNSTTSTGSSSSSAQQSAQSSESDTDDSGMDSSDESTRQQEHEAAYGLLSLSQKPTQTSGGGVDMPHMRSKSPAEAFMTTEELAHVSKTIYAKNKFLDQQHPARNSTFKNNTEVDVSTNEETTECQNVRIYLGMGSIGRPLTYPYTTVFLSDEPAPSPKIVELESRPAERVVTPTEPKSIKQFNVIQKYVPQAKLSPKLPENSVRESAISVRESALGVRESAISVREPALGVRQSAGDARESALSIRQSAGDIRESALSARQSAGELRESAFQRKPDYGYEETLNNSKPVTAVPNRTLPTLKINDVVVNSGESVTDLRKRKFSLTEFPYKNKIQKNDEVMDLSMANNLNGVLHEEKSFRVLETQKNIANEIFNTLHKPASPPRCEINEDREEPPPASQPPINNGTVIILRPLTTTAESSDEPSYNDEHEQNSSSNHADYDNSAMETLADIATKQVKLEKNTMAKSVASEYLKLATKNENIDSGLNAVNFGPVNKDVNDIIVKSEGNKSCTICSKSFNKPSQLRLHMNIHYLERPFRCDSCSVSFRTKGHLQKHERSASHHNKLSSSPTLSSSEPRPFKCSDCNIAFRIHGHLAKHLRSKMHIQKLECLKKLPFGLYAELERSNSLLTEINTSDGDQCLESLKTLAKKVFINHPNKLNELEQRETVMADS